MSLPQVEGLNNGILNGRRLQPFLIVLNLPLQLSFILTTESQRLSGNVYATDLLTVRFRFESLYIIELRIMQVSQTKYIARNGNYRVDDSIARPSLVQRNAESKT